MNINLDDLTIGEMILFEDTTGKPLSALGEGAGAREMQALALIFLRRDNPEATLEDAAAVKVSAFTDTVDTADPTTAIE